MIPGRRRCNRNAVMAMLEKKSLQIDAQVVPADQHDDPEPPSSCGSAIHSLDAPPVLLLDRPAGPARLAAPRLRQGLAPHARGTPSSTASLELLQEHRGQACEEDAQTVSADQHDDPEPPPPCGSGIRSLDAPPVLLLDRPTGAARLATPLLRQGLAPRAHGTPSTAASLELLQKNQRKAHEEDAQTVSADQHDDPEPPSSCGSGIRSLDAPPVLLLDRPAELARLAAPQLRQGLAPCDCGAASLELLQKHQGKAREEDDGAENSSASSSALDWFKVPATGAVELEDLTALIKEPIGDTQSLLNKFTSKKATFYSTIVHLGEVAILLEKAVKDYEKVNVILEAVMSELNMSDPNCDLIHCAKYWSCLIKFEFENEMLRTTHLTIPESWTTTYLKATFFQLFGIHGIKLALDMLADVTKDCSLQLYFLKARLLGQLRFLEQWKVADWVKEKTIIKEIAMENLETQIYYAHFCRTEAYRSFLENRYSQGFRYSREGMEMSDQINNVRSMHKNLDQELQKIAENKSECLAWLCDEILRLPREMDTSADFSGVQRQLAKAFSSGSSSYALRVGAWFCENHEKKYTIAQQHLVIAAGNSSRAHFELMGLMYRSNPRFVPDFETEKRHGSNLHKAFFLSVCHKNRKEARKSLLSKYLRTPDSSSILVYEPVFLRLNESINLLHCVIGSVTNSTYLFEHEEICQESRRLKTNYMFFKNKHFIQKLKKDINKVPSSSAMMPMSSDDEDYYTIHNPFRKSLFD